MKVIFLDIDGVLNSGQYLSRTDHEQSSVYQEIDLEKVRLLAEVASRTDTQIVLSSSWREMFYKMQPTEPSAQNLLTALSEQGLEIMDMTPDLEGMRGTEIRAWLAEHPVEGFVILDDEAFPDWAELADHWVRTSYYEGLIAANVEEAVRILNRNSSGKQEKAFVFCWLWWI